MSAAFFLMLAVFVGIESPDTNTLIAAMMIRRGDADAMLGGLVGRYEGHLEHVRDVIGLAPGALSIRCPAYSPLVQSQASTRNQLKSLEGAFE